VEAVKGWHAAGVGAMRRGEASGREILFSPDRFRQSRDDRRAIIFAFCESCKIGNRKFLKSKNAKIV
jgi:hypothetical protein